MNTNTQRGFNLLELLVTLIVVSVVLGFGVPSFLETVRTNRMATASNEILGALIMARNEAVKLRAPVTVCGSANPTDANPVCGGGVSGWVLFADTNDTDADGQPDGNVLLEAGEVVLRASTGVDPSVTLFADGGYASFAGSGFARTFLAAGPRLTQILLCDARGNEDLGGGISAARVLTLAQTGRAQILNRVADVVAAGGCP